MGQHLKGRVSHRVGPVDQVGRVGQVGLLLLVQPCGQRQPKLPGAATAKQTHCVCWPLVDDPGKLVVLQLLLLLI